MLKQESDKIMDEAKTPTSKSPSDSINFRWSQEIPQYGYKLLQRLDEFRRKNMYYDIILKTNDAKFSAHKIVLAACGGIFWRQNPDLHFEANSDRITELRLNCAGVGLRTIIKFAYSGVLQINQGNVLSAFHAAVATEMKEIRDICSAIAISKFGWMLKFNGTEDSLPKNFDNDEKKLNLEIAFDMLHQLLLANRNLTTNQNPTNLDKLDQTQTNFPYHPCLEAVEKYWAELKSTYIAVMDVLWTMEQLQHSQCTSSGTENKTHVASSQPKIESIETSKKSFKIQPDEDEQSLSAAFSSTRQDDDSSQKSSSITSSTSEVTAKASTASKLVPSEHKAAKDALLSTQQQLDQTRQVSNDSPQSGQHSDFSLAPTPNSSSPSSNHPVALSPPQKDVACSPPIPPNSIHKPEIPLKPARLNTNSNKSSKQPSKVPPPRPKPPVFHQKIMKAKTDDKEYNDALNPFAQ